MFNAQLNRYYVTVTAVRGGEKSESTTSNIFSYNENSINEMNCMFSLFLVEISPISSII